MSVNTEICEAHGKQIIFYFSFGLKFRICNLYFSIFLPLQCIVFEHVGGLQIFQMSQSLTLSLYINLEGGMNSRVTGQLRYWSHTYPRYTIRHIMSILMFYSNCY